MFGRTHKIASTAAGPRTAPSGPSWLPLAPGFGGTAEGAPGASIEGAADVDDGAAARSTPGVPGTLDATRPRTATAAAVSRTAVRERLIFCI